MNAITAALESARTVRGLELQAIGGLIAGYWHRKPVFIFLQTRHNGDKHLPLAFIAGCHIDPADAINIGFSAKTMSLAFGQTTRNIEYVVRGKINKPDTRVAHAIESMRETVRIMGSHGAIAGFLKRNWPYTHKWRGGGGGGGRCRWEWRPWNVEDSQPGELVGSGTSVNWNSILATAEPIT